jgi:sporulation protein YlmC with PRC-barrel domain
VLFGWFRPIETPFPAEVGWRTNNMKELIIVAGLIGITVVAQEAPNAPAQSATAAANPQIVASGIDAFHKASSVIGTPVRDSKGKVVGKVQDLVIDFDSKKIGYAVLALQENRIVPVPMTALKRAESGDHFVLNMTPALLAAAPGIQNDDWPGVDAFAVGAPAQTETGHGKSSDESGH